MSMYTCCREWGEHAPDCMVREIEQLRAENAALKVARDGALEERSWFRTALKETVDRADDCADSWISRPAREALRGKS